jgi:hypothetical protein
MDLYENPIAALRLRASSHGERQEGEAEVLVLVLACSFCLHGSTITLNNTLFLQILVTSNEEPTAYFFFHWQSHINIPKFPK